MIADVAVPAIVDHVPKGGRNRRLEFVRTVAPLEVQELQVAAFERGPSLASRGGDRVSVYLKDGEPWMRLTGDNGHGFLGNPDPVRAETFLRFLADADGLDQDIHDSLLARFARTPLVADRRAGARHALLMTPRTRGIERRIEQSRIVHDDGTSRALAAAQSFLANDVALVDDGGVLARVKPVTFAYDVARSVRVLDYTVCPVLRDGGGYPGAVDRVDEYLAYWEEGLVDPAQPTTSLCLLEKAPWAAGRVHDLVFLANSVPELVAADAQAVVMVNEGQDVPRELKDAVEELARMAFRGSVGGFAEQDMVETLDRLRTLSETVMRLHPWGHPRSYSRKSYDFAHYFDRVVTPRLKLEVIEEADMDALAETFAP